MINSGALLGYGLVGWSPIIRFILDNAGLHAAPLF
jgi:hypothetical protein